MPVTDPRLHGLVPAHVPDFRQGENPYDGVLVEIPGWHSWSDGRKLDWLTDFVSRYEHDPAINTFVGRNVVAGAPQRDGRAEAQAILRWVQTNIRYQNEKGEQIRSPFAALRDRVGDCDDLAILIATFAGSIGLPWRFAIAGKDRRTGRGVRYVHRRGRSAPSGVDFYHVYVQVGFPALTPPEKVREEDWMSAEPTLGPNIPLGYDVVMDGLPGQMAEARSYAGAIQAEPEQQPQEKPAGFLMQVWREISWVNLVAEAFRSIAIAAAVALGVPVVTKWLTGKSRA